MIIDLLNENSDDDDDSDLFKQMTPIFASSKRKSPDNVADAEPFFADQQRAAANSRISSQNQHLVLLGTFLSSILDSQHFPAPANPGDKVSLQHDHGSMFDRNAIKAITSTGSKLGLLPRDHAAIVCPKIQTLSHMLTFQATILSVSSDRRKIKIVVDVYAKSSRALTPKDMQQRKDEVIPMLETLYSKSGREGGSVQHQKKAMQVPSDECSIELAQEVAQRKAPSQTTTLALQEDFIPADVDMSMMLDWESQHQELDKMFEEIQQKQLENLPDIPMTKQLEKMELFDYQKNGIRWLYNQETSDQLPSWFHRRCNGNWFCTVTGLQQTKDPRPVRGSLLADDMGLGVSGPL